MLTRLALLLFAASSLAAQRTRNVVLVVTDGLRWQDVFTGADSTILFGDPRFLGDTIAIRRDFWRPTADERRRAMMPFFWSTVARDGQIYGNATKGSSAQITNGLKFSYPGYNEMLTGAADPQIRSNSFGLNPNVTVFEWLSKKPEFAGKVAAFGTWGVFADIFNRERAGFVVHAGWEPPIASPRTRSDSLLDRLYSTTFRTWDDNAYDSFMQASLLDYLRANRPRVLFVGYGETDEWAHSGRYDRVLRSARAVDAYIAELWNKLQSLPEYRGTTSMIITTDHGRGSLGTTWRDHGESVAGAEDIWIAVIGPDTPALGERTKIERVTQAQIAGTVAALLGQTYPRGAPALKVRN
ncbi:MAG TPA: alkaline phosphatase family protein [Gemmatimonadaceae bacterium]